MNIGSAKRECTGENDLKNVRDAVERFLGDGGIEFLAECGKRTAPAGDFFQRPLVDGKNTRP